MDSTSNFIVSCSNNREKINTLNEVAREQKIFFEQYTVVGINGCQVEGFAFKFLFGLGAGLTRTQSCCLIIIMSSIRFSKSSTLEKLLPRFEEFPVASNLSWKTILDDIEKYIQLYTINIVYYI